MRRFLSHITTDGERWDHLADRYYGDPYRYVAIVEANPQIPLYPILPAGLTLLIPVLEPETSPDDLPPWKRP